MESRASSANRKSQVGKSSAVYEELSAEFRQRLPERAPEALAAFYEAYFARIYGFVRRMVGEEHLAEDLTQDIFMHLQQTFPSYDATRPLQPWVFTIATNKVRDYWRSRRHKLAQREVQIVEDERGGSLSAPEASPSKPIEDRELARTLARAVSELSDGMRMALVLRYFQGLSFAEIGVILDRNETAVRKRYSRALEELRKILAKLAEAETEERP